MDGQLSLTSYIMQQYDLKYFWVDVGLPVLNFAAAKARFSYDEIKKRQCSVVSIPNQGRFVLFVHQEFAHQHGRARGHTFYASFNYKHFYNYASFQDYDGWYEFMKMTSAKPQDLCWFEQVKDNIPARLYIDIDWYYLEDTVDIPHVLGLITAGVRTVYLECFSIEIGDADWGVLTSHKPGKYSFHLHLFGKGAFSDNDVHMKAFMFEVNERLRNNATLRRII